MLTLPAISAPPAVKLRLAVPRGSRGRLALFATALLAALTSGLPAAGATLRNEVLLSGPEVRLSDLFDQAGANAARVLGPGPAPGGRITVEAPQLAAIARQFGVDWQPNSPGDRVVLERPGRLMPREPVLEALRHAIVDANDAGDTDLEIGGFTPPMLAPEAKPEVIVEQVDQDAESGRFTAVVAVSTADSAPMRLRIVGRAVQMTQALVAAHTLMPGVPLGAGDLRIARVRLNLLRDGGLQDAAPALGLAPRHAIAAGAPVLRGELAQPVLVPRGANVLVVLQAPGMNLSSEGQALDAGGLGERIKVMNISSHAVLDAEVVGPNRVRVLPGSLPSVGPQRPLAMLDADQMIR